MCSLCAIGGTVLDSCSLTRGVIGIVGLLKDGDAITEISFDILSLEALFLVPR